MITSAKVTVSGQEGLKRAGSPWKNSGPLFRSFRFENVRKRPYDFVPDKKKLRIIGNRVFSRFRYAFRYITTHGHAIYVRKIKLYGRFVVSGRPECLDSRKPNV